MDLALICIKNLPHKPISVKLAELRKLIKDQFTTLRLLNEELIRDLSVYASEKNCWELPFTDAQTFKETLEQLNVIKDQVLTGEHYNLIATTENLPSLQELRLEMDREIKQELQLRQRLKTLLYTA